MTQQQFEAIFEKQIERCRTILCKKASEYAADGDRLHNFRRAAAFQETTMEQVLFGFALKHFTSVMDLCNSMIAIPTEMWDEKITDSINYLLLLRAVVEEGHESIEQGSN